MTCARLASDSDAAEENVCDTLEALSKPIPNVLTNFLTKLNVLGVICAPLTEKKIQNKKLKYYTKICDKISGQFDILSILQKLKV